MSYRAYVRAVKPLLSTFFAEMPPSNNRASRSRSRSRRARISRSRSAARGRLRLSRSASRSRSRRSRSLSRSRSRSRSGYSSGRSTPGVGSMYNETDGLKHVRFNHGRVKKSNAKKGLSMRRHLTPINSHIVIKEGMTFTSDSDQCAYETFVCGPPSDIRDIIEKAKTVVQGDTGTAFGGVNGGYDGRFSVYSYDSDVELRNQGNAQVHLTVYELVARENIVQLLNDTLYNTIDNIVQTGFARKNPNSGGCTSATDIDGTLYHNPVLLHHFRIAKSRSLTLNAGEELKLALTHGHPRTINPLELQNVNTPQYIAKRDFTRLLIVRVQGSMVTNLLQPANENMQGHTSGFKLVWRHRNKYRWNSIPWSGEMVTQTDPDSAVLDRLNQGIMQNDNGNAGVMIYE